MIRGMTGFGISNFSYKNKRFVINVRSVNHKFLDYVINVPDEISHLEAEIKKTLTPLLHRGRVTIQLICQDYSEKKPILDKKLLMGYFSLIRDANRSLKIKQDISITDLIRLPDVIYYKKTEDNYGEKFSALFKRALIQAVTKLVNLRKEEGKSIHKDLMGRINKIDTKLSQIKKRSEMIIAASKKRLIGDELREFLTSSNIAEEISRLDYHLETFRDGLEQSGSLGKVLDFISQEMQREINTLGAKFRDSKVTYDSVIIKNEAEKIREQLQNVE